MDEQTDELDVLALLRNAAESRVKLAESMLRAYAANALPQPATPEDIVYWEKELADARMELLGMHDAHRT
jgi:hypothetical protein